MSDDDIPSPPSSEEEHDAELVTTLPAEWHATIKNDIARQQTMSTQPPLSLNYNGPDEPNQ